MVLIPKNPLPAPLRAEDLKGQEVVIATVEKVLVEESSKQKLGIAVIIMTKEFPGKGLYLNETSKEEACKGFKSNDGDDWAGKRFPIIPVRSEDPRYEKDHSLPQYSVRPWVAPHGDWASLIKKHGKKS